VTLPFPNAWHTGYFSWLADLLRKPPEETINAPKEAPIDGLPSAARPLQRYKTYEKRYLVKLALDLHNKSGIV
jgi:hypothetical protein